MAALLFHANPPQVCDVCQTPFVKVFYDMKTVGGPWGNLCPTCALLGPGCGRLGTGFGQKYEKQPDGRFLKTAG